MSKDLTITLENRPGTLADMGEVLGRAGINIDGIGGFVTAGEGIFHILVEDGEAARRALEEAGMQARDERDVLVLAVEDRPGVLGDVTRRLAAAGVNIDLAYLVTKTRLVIGVDDLERARAAV